MRGKSKSPHKGQHILTGTPSHHTSFHGRSRSPASKMAAAEPSFAPNHIITDGIVKTKKAREPSISPAAPSCIPSKQTPARKMPTPSPPPPSTRENDSHRPSASPSNRPESDDFTVPKNLTQAPKTSSLSPTAASSTGENDFYLPSASPINRPEESGDSELIPALPPSNYPTHAPFWSANFPTIDMTLQPSESDHFGKTFNESPTTGMPSKFPEMLECYNSSMNIFGQTSQHPIILVYAYETIYNETLGRIASILPALEVEITHLILNSSLVHECKQYDTRLLTSTNGTIVGISSSPPDVPMSKLCLGGLGSDLEDNMNNGGYGCKYIEGRMILYISKDSLSAEKQIANDTFHTIKRGMETGALVRAHEAIIHLSFIEDRRDDVLPGRNPQQKVDDSPGKNTDSGDNVLPLFALLLVASSATLILATYFFTFRLRTRQDGLAYGELDCISYVRNTFDDISE